jgi:hypothetical protein
VPIEKKDSRKIRVCIDFRDLNRATLKDEYPMPIADMLINDASGHRVISFLDSNAGYNQILWPRKTCLRRPSYVLGLLVSLSRL